MLLLSRAKPSELQSPKAVTVGNVNKTDKTENFSDKTKVNDSENSEEKLKDISNTDKKTYG